jgi:UDP-N-acetylmuramate--alanine ligase
MTQHVHFIGIGGIGVSGVAQLALKQGHQVSGSDLKESSITRRLVHEGAQVFLEHRSENIKGADLVVYSSAISPNNPELVAARDCGIPVQRRAEFLSVLMANKKVITITGAHGKTTTSSLAAHLLISSGLHPTLAVGGILREDGDNAKLGDSSYFVAEADESDGTFLCYRPMYSIITNIDQEHMDFYKTTDNLLGYFSKFVSQTEKNGCVFYCFEDEALKDIIKKSSVRSVSFGFSPQADLVADNIHLDKCRISFSCFKKGGALGEVALGLAGRHNILNALSVIALGQELGIDFKMIQKALASFKGVERRFQIKFENKNFLVVDDYGHHPTEIAATLEAAKLCGRRRLVVVFQPHRFSRTHLLMDALARSLEGADVLFVTDIYAAGEKPIAGVGAEQIVERVKINSSMTAEYVPKDQIIGELKKNIVAQDLILFLGAGDITKISDEFSKSFD